MSQINNSVEFNKNFCLYIRKNGKQCMLKPDSDILSQGRCFRHRVVKRLPQMTREQRQEHWNQKDIYEEKHGKQPKTLEEKITEEYWKKYYEEVFKKYCKASDSVEERSKPHSNDILRDRAITTKEEWKSWIVRNHPDKGGDTKMFIDVLKAGRLVF
jgi:hypothetical protein